jgi:hypothetical protein
VYAVQAFIQFDPLLLQVVDALGNPATSVTPGPGLTPFANRVGPDAELLAGEIWFSGGNFGGLNTDFLVATMDVKALPGFTSASLALPSPGVTRGSIFCESKVIDLSVPSRDVTGELRGASLYGSGGVLIPEPLTVSLFGVGAGLLATRSRRRLR